MDNLARKTKEPRRVEYIDLNKVRPGNWQYVDVDKLEARIRQEETEKWVKLRREERERKKLRKEAFWSTIMATLVIRLIGVAIIFVGTSAALYFHLGEAALCAWPIGILFIICPGHNNIEENIQKYIDHKKKEEK